MKSILITGAQGQLGLVANQHFTQQGWDVHAFTHEDFDITDNKATKQIIEEIRPSVLFNAAAYTNVEAAEESFERAESVNVLGVKNIVTSCNRVKTKLVHISSDYVFDGKSNHPYTETASLNPLNVYGKTKARADMYIQDFSQDYLILRSSWIYSAQGHNFLLTILKLAEQLKNTPTPLRVVKDQIGTPTSTYQIVRCADELLSLSAQGLFNCTAKGSTSWFGFAEEIFRQLQITETSLEPCLSEAYPQKATRPPYSVLSLEKLNNLGIITAPWQDALSEEILKLYKGIPGNQL